MTPEEKRLLLKDLCGRLPYGIIVHIHDINVDDYDRRLIGEDLDFIELDRRNCKPYLRPMSSMTKEEDEEWRCYKSGIAESSDELLGKKIDELHDWFYRKHIDFRGLIPLGLALEAPKDMYKNE